MSVRSEREGERERERERENIFKKSWYQSYLKFETCKT